jgi:hypothetical protein
MNVEMLAYFVLGIIGMIAALGLRVMHKLMIEADEETYLQTANKLTPI